MVRKLPGPIPVQMYFVKPHVKRGDYHLFINPITGRRMWAYPRMMGERRFPVVSALGSNGDTASELLSIFDPRQLTEQIDQARAELNQTQSLLKVAVVASIASAAVAIWALTRPREEF